MSKVLSRRAFLGSAGAAGLLAASPALAEAPTRSLRPVGRDEDLSLRNLLTPEEIIEAARLDGTVGFAVMNLATGEVLEQHEAETGMPPASVAKALTASYALDTLGPGFHFATEVIGTGPLTDGVLDRLDGGESSLPGILLAVGCAIVGVLILFVVNLVNSTGLDSVLNLGDVTGSAPTAPSTRRLRY